MSKELNNNKKALLNLYWYALIILAVIGVVNLFAISAVSLRSAAIVNLVFLIFVPIIFVLGYIDYRNYMPFTSKREFAYVLTAVIALWIFLIHFNVQNYTFLSDFMGETLYFPEVSAITALYLSIGTISVLITLMNSHNRKKQVKCYYAVAISSLISTTFLISFTYDTNVALFWAPLRLSEIFTPIVIDTGMAILGLRVLVEYCIFLFHAVQEKRKGLLRAGEESEYRKPIICAAAIAVFFMLINELVLPCLLQAGANDYTNIEAYGLAYNILEIISVIALLSLGVFIAMQKSKSKKYGQIYLRMGIASIVFAVVFLFADFIPITRIITPNNEAHAIAIEKTYAAIIKMLGLLCYTLYVAFNKKLNATIHILDIEHAEKSSAENYAI